MKHNKTISALAAFILAFAISATSVFADSPRMGLVEQATNTSCGPCASANPAFQKYINENMDVVIPLVYHFYYPSTADPMYQEDVPMNDGRTKIYYGITGVPHFYFNGTTHGHPNSINSLIGSTLQSMRSEISPIDIKITETRNGSQATVDVEVSSSEDLSNKKLRIAVVEYEITYASPPGSNGEKEFFWVARKMLPDHNGTTINVAAGGTETISETFQLKTHWDKTQIYYIAFIQDDATKEILQAAHNLKVKQAPMEVAQKYLQVDPNNEVTNEITVSNPGDEEVTARLSIDDDASGIPSGWDASVSPNMVTIPAKGTATATVKIECGPGAGFAGAVVKAEPVTIGDEKANTTTVATYALSTATKYALYASTDGLYPIFYGTFLGLQDYAADAALLPFNEEVFDAYPAADMFDFAFFAFDYGNRGILGGDSYFGSLPSKLYNVINGMIFEGKKILITSQLDLYYAYGANGSYAAREFFGSTLGLESGGINQRIQTNQYGQITGVVSFPMTGVAGDPIGDGASYTLNQYNSQSYPYFIYYTDQIRLKNPTSSTAFMYFDNDPTHIGGVRAVVGDGAKVVYMSPGFGAFANSSQRSTFMKKCVDWLFEEPELEAKIEIQTTDVNFGTITKEDEYGEEMITIQNTGTKDLTITAMEILYDQAGAFEIMETPAEMPVIEPGGFYDVFIKFTPTEDKVYGAELYIESDAVNYPEFSVMLRGEGDGFDPGAVYENGVIDGLFTMKAAPNPMVDESKISFTLNGQGERVEMYVIDSRGTKVASLVDSYVQPGTHSVDFGGFELSSGQYFAIAKVAGRYVRLPIIVTK